jgi:hypothetical protein
MQSGALIETRRHELRRDFVVGQSFEKRSPAPVANSIYLLNALPIRSDFFGCCGTKGGFER